MAYPPVVATNARDSDPKPENSTKVHEKGAIHRIVHMEFVRTVQIVLTSGILQRDDIIPLEQYLLWYRADGRLEIPGGHVDWLPDKHRAETYEEAALREAAEELGRVGKDPTAGALEKAKEELRRLANPRPVAYTVNQLPSSHGNNNEWVSVYRFDWPEGWDEKAVKGSEEGNYDPQWWSVPEIERCALENPMCINAALRLFLQRRGILIPLELDFMKPDQRPSVAGFGKYEWVIRKRKQ